MTELRLRELISGMGRSDAGRYHCGAYSKHEERERVLTFMLNYFPQGSRVRLLSMPGESWMFEHMLLLARPGSQVVGIEKSHTAYMISRRAMPRNVRAKFNMLSDRTKTFGAYRYTYSRTRAREDRHGGANETKVARRGTRSHRLLLMSLDLYSSMMTTDFGATVPERAEFHSRFYNRNAVWLDFTSMIHGAIEETLSRLHLCVTPRAHDDNDNARPFVVTVLNGRDRFHGTEERIAAIVAAQPLLRHVEHWTYVGKGGCSMLTACFEID